jgi:hypothetical protein
VDVVASGTLAYNGGPIRDPDGKVIGRFNSIWRLEAGRVAGRLRHCGSDFCDCKK